MNKINQFGVVLALAWMFVSASHAGISEISTVPEGEEFATGEMSAGEPWTVHELDVPPNARMVTITLLIGSPSLLDLDLYVFDGPPQLEGEVNFDDFYRLSPLCESNFRGPIESCEIERPESGRLWIALEPYEGKGKTQYQLQFSFVDVGSVDPSYELLRLDSSVRLGNEERGYYFELDEGDVATLILQGTNRVVTVRDADGNEYKSAITEIGRKQVWLGAQFKPYDAILMGLPHSAIFTVTIAGYDDPFGQRITQLSLVGPPEDGYSQVADHFLIPFSPQQTKYLSVNKRDGRPKKTSGKLQNMLASYYVPRSQLGTIVTIEPVGGFVVAICDRLGFVYDISNSQVHLKTEMGVGNEGVYLIVIKNEFSEETGIKYQLNFEQDFSQMSR